MVGPLEYILSEPYRLHSNPLSHRPVLIACMHEVVDSYNYKLCNKFLNIIINLTC